jgi:hypothetical protein
VTVAVLILALLPAAAAAGDSIGDVIALVRTSIRSGEPDDRLAKTLTKARLTERLDLRAVEELESEGAGPKSVAQLALLAEASKSLAPPAVPPAFDSPPRPGTTEQNAFFQEVARNAMHYAAGLPDFICTQVARRYTAAANRDNWGLKDTLTIKLSYFGNQEQYELLQVDGRKTSRTYENVGGAVSGGEFGSMLLDIFDPSHKTEFRWSHWTHLRKRLTQVYSYRGKLEYAGYRLLVGTPYGGMDEIIVGHHGLVYMDNETRMVMRIVAEADGIPAAFTVRAHSVAVDYGFADVGGKPYLLPLRAEVRVRTQRMQNKNEVEFQGYRKFASESVISFGEGDPVKK